MPDWLKRAGQLSVGAIFGMVGLMLTQGALKMVGLNLPTWAYFAIAGLLGIVAILVYPALLWLYRNYEQKRLKRPLLRIVAILSACWLTWPWPKVVNLFEYIKLKPPVHEEIYMSEDDVEQYVIDQLRRSGDRPVFKTRARYLIFCEHKWRGRRTVQASPRQLLECA